MRIRSKRLSGLVAIAAAGLLVVSACGGGGGGGGQTQQQSSAGFATCDKQPNTCNSGTTKAGGTLTVASEKKLPCFAVYDEECNVYDTSVIMNGLVPNVVTLNPDFTI